MSTYSEATRPTSESDLFERDNDLASVTAFLRGVGVLPGDEAPPSFRLLAGGRSNLTYRFRTRRGEFVLRRPPASNRLLTAHDMAREYQIMSALRGSGVAVPEGIALCEEESVNDGIPFYVMSFVDGVTVDGDRVTTETSEADREVLTAATIDQLARIHDPANLGRPGVAALDRGPGYLERQVRRWTRQWATATTRRLPDAERAAAWLTARVPPDAATSLVHGDFRIDNCLYDASDLGRVLAVVDWELGTVGDPYTDLAMFLLYWVRPGDPRELVEMFPSANMSRHTGFPDRDWILHRYAEASGTRWRDERFYMALASFKLAAICEGIHARFVAGGTRGSHLSGYDKRAATLMRYACRVIAGDHAFTQAS
jgi:aminoglycoside phosphotransferase (APT) family kinase protein